ncbi:ATP-dependent protease ClpP protease subunit [Bradyrhizobium sp. USDA 4011]
MADLNRAGRAFARDLIAGDNIDRDSAWSLTADDGNTLLGDAGSDWANYGKHHLGIDTTENFDTKDHWKYPFAKDGKIYRSALVAIRQRSSSQKDKVVYDAAGALLDEIDGDTDSSQAIAGKGPNAGGGVITVANRPPRIEVQPRSDLASSAPASPDCFSRWNPGIRAATADEPNVIEMFDVIGYDFWSGGGITAESVSSQLKSFSGQPVEVQINSPGGDMFEGIAIYNLLNQYPGKVTVKVMALAASAASVIAMAGDDVQIGQGAFIMIHNCWVMAIGNRNDMREVADYLEPFDQALRDIYVARTGMKANDVATYMDDETFIGARQAIDEGFADTLLSQEKIKEDKKAAASSKSKIAALHIEAALVRRGHVPAAQARSMIVNAAGAGADGTPAVREIEKILTRNDGEHEGMSRGTFRALIRDLKSGTPAAAANQSDVMPGADVGSKPGAGQAELLTAIAAFKQVAKS